MNNDTLHSPLITAIDQALALNVINTRPHSNSSSQSFTGLLDGIVAEASRAINSEINGYFNRFSENNGNLKNLLAVPRLLSTSYYLGSSVTLPAMASPKFENSHLILELCGRNHRAFEQYPDTKDLIRIIADLNFDDGQYTFGELFWLWKLSEWLQCITPDFYEKIVKPFFIDNKEIYKLDFLESRKYSATIIDGVSIGVIIKTQYRNDQDRLSCL